MAVEVEVRYPGRRSVRVPNGTDDEILRSAVDRLGLGNPEHYRLIKTTGGERWLVLGWHIDQHRR